MEQRTWWKNLTGTVCVLGLAFSSMNCNSTTIIPSFNEASIANYRILGEQTDNSSANLADETNNIYIKTQRNNLEAEAKSLFGDMRDATAEESASVENYVKSISKDMGVNFFDLC